MGNKFCEGFGRSFGIQINLRITKKLCTDELDIKLSFYILEMVLSGKTTYAIVHNPILKR